MGKMTNDYRLSADKVGGLFLCLILVGAETGKVTHPSDHCKIMAEQLGANHPAILLSTGHTKGSLHDQRHRIAQDVIT